MLITGRTQLIPHLGWPTEAFKAPMIYNPWFEQAGVDAVVVPMGVRPDDYPQVLAALARLTNVRGALVTMPHKVATMALVAEASPAAQIAGAANALRLRDDGTWLADQFDGAGFVRGVERKGFAVAGKRAIVSGSGGVGSAIAASLAGAGVAGLMLHDRDPAAADALRGRLLRHHPDLAVETGSVDPAGFDLVVNATPLGMKDGDPLPFDVERIAPSSFVGEVVMKVETTPLLVAAQARGCAIQRGTDMLFEMIPAYLEFFGLPVATPEQRRAVATVSLSGTLRDKLEAIAAAGFDAIELFEPDFVHSPLSAHDVRSLCDDLGLGIDLYQPLRDFEGMPDALHAKNLERAERKFDLVQRLGAPLVLVCSNVSPQSLGDAARSAAQLAELAERAARRGLRIGYEALAWGRHVRRFGEAWRIVEAAGHPSLGLVLDSFHTLSLGDDPEPIADLPGDRVFFVQMADAPLLAMDVLQWARHFRNFPGQGQFDVVRFFAAVVRSGYAGTLSLEIFNDVFRATPNRRIAVDAMRSLLWLESETKRRLAATDAAPPRVALAEPPDATVLGGFAFVEFGADEAEADALGDWLGRFGFERAGAHRSKRATLWRQGEAAIVVDAEPGSDARARFEELGPVVSAIGLVSDDAPRAVARAAALRSAPFESPIGPAELTLPAFRSPGGMLIHFVPREVGVEGLAAADFAVAANDAPAPHDATGVRRIDHLALALAADQLDTWMLFGRAVLGLSPGASLELADPFGLVRSGGIASADRHVRFVLNVSVGERTGTARAVAAHSGKPSVQHVALACHDIVATVEALTRRGARFVAVSPNYHDDLQARFGLDDATTARLREAGVLYDRDELGEFWHVYGEPWRGRFFFELVERRGYDAYGAVNAPSRMAAQALPPSAPEISA